MRGLPCVKNSEGFHLYQLMLPRDYLGGGILAPHLLSGLIDPSMGSVGFLSEGVYFPSLETDA